METVIKTVKQYSYPLEEEIVSELAFIGNQYKNVRNYVYSRFSGINSILLLLAPRKIRDAWVRSGFYKEWKLPARYWKSALSEAISNIKTSWTNLKKKIRVISRMNEKLSDVDIHYINYILKFNRKRSS